MNQPNSSAEEHLIRLIRAGDQDGWAQAVSRFHGRMLAFARHQVGDADAEDVVQETFIAFVRSLDSYREQTNLESWLFRILRRRIIDHYRARGSRREIPACAVVPASGENSEAPIHLDPLDPAASPSAYVRDQEQLDEYRQSLSAALSTVIDRMREQQNLRDLMIIEGLFYAGIKNRSLAAMLDIDEGAVAVVRHRTLQRLREHIGKSPADGPVTELQEDLLTGVWEQDRPSCPKRSTLGKSLMGILDAPWQQYIAFHIDTIQCRYCAANRDDLSLPTETTTPATLDGSMRRIFDSTVGFINMKNR